MSKIEISYKEDFRTVCSYQGKEIWTDAPKDNEGKGEFFSPTDLLATALGSCALTLMGIAAKRLGVSMKGVKADVEKTMKLTPVRSIGRLIVHIYFPGVIDEKLTETLERAAKGCPVHYSLHPDVIQEFHFHYSRGK